MVTFKTVNNPVDAHLLKVKLESEGIRCELRYQASCEEQETSTIAIELLVLLGDIEHARNVIDKSNPSVSDEKNFICPRCKTANNLSANSMDKHLRAFIESLFTLSTLNYQRKEPKMETTSCTCKHCGLSYAPSEQEKTT